MLDTPLNWPSYFYPVNSIVRILLYAFNGNYNTCCQAQHHHRYRHHRRLCNTRMRRVLAVSCRVLAVILGTFTAKINGI